MARKSAVIRAVFFGVLILAVLGFSAMLFMVQSYKWKLAALTVPEVDFRKVAAGVYEGVQDVGLVSAAVRVTVTNGIVTNIVVFAHKHGPGYGAEALLPVILKKQSLAVDAVSKATGSSKVLRLAVADALKKGLPR